MMDYWPGLLSCRDGKWVSARVSIADTQFTQRVDTWVSIPSIGHLIFLLPRGMARLNPRLSSRCSQVEHETPKRFRTRIALMNERIVDRLAARLRVRYKGEVLNQVSARPREAETGIHRLLKSLTTSILYHSL